MYVSPSRSVFFNVYIYFYVRLSIYNVYPSVFIYLSIFMFIYLSLYVRVSLTDFLSSIQIHLCFCLSFYVCMYICMHISFCVYLFLICVCIFLYIFLTGIYKGGSRHSCITHGTCRYGSAWSSYCCYCCCCCCCCLSLLFISWSWSSPLSFLLFVIVSNVVNFLPLFPFPHV